MTEKHPRWKRLFFRYGESPLRSAWPKILSATLFAAVVTYVEHGLHLETYSLTATPFTIMGVAISFFLSFRNSTAYNRFWEARTLWGRLINVSRTFAGQILTQHTAPVSEDSAAGNSGPAQALSAYQRGAIGATIAYAHALFHHLRDTDSSAALGGWLSAEEIGWVRTQANIPCAITYLMRKRVQYARRQHWLSDSDILALESSITEIVSVQGGCERIKNTPFPITYTLLSHRIVFVFCFMMPFGLLDTTKVLTPLVVFLVAYAFFGLDALGEEISEPFGNDPHDLPLPLLTATIEKELELLLTEAGK